jgi:hypothetical protein
MTQSESWLMALEPRSWLTGGPGRRLSWDLPPPWTPVRWLTPRRGHSWLSSTNCLRRGHGDVDQLALVPVLVAGYQDREVVEEEPLAFFSHDHEAELVQKFLGIDGSETRVEDHIA